MPLMTDNPVVIIAILLAAAVVGGMVAHRLRQPVILGYLVIGAAVGPHALGLVSDTGIVETAATMGVALLMFTLGLETSFGQLRRMGRIGLFGGLLQIVATLGIGLLAGLVLFGWSVTQSALFGLIISLSSTAVCLKILMERGELDSMHGRIMIAMLIIQDVSVVAMTVIVPLMGGSMDRLLPSLLEAIGKALFFSAVAIASGLWILPWIMGRVGGVRTRELFLLIVLALCLGAALSTQIFGLSSVFGAFLIGLIVHESKFAHQALAEITPLRDIFATLFFVSLGMLFDASFVANNWGLVLTTVAVIVVIKFGIVFGVVRFFRFGGGVASLTAAALLQIGEFGFILAQAGVLAGVVSAQFYSLILASAIATMLITPFSIGLASRLQRRRIALGGGKGERNAGASDLPDVDGPGRVVIAGYGRIGLNMAQGLRDANIPITAIDIDPQRIESAREDCSSVLHGDASNPVILRAARISEAKVLAVTFPDPVAIINTVRNSLELNPRLKVVARVHRDREAQNLNSLGKIELVSPEYEASLEFLRRTLKAAGWTRRDIEKTLPTIEKEEKEMEFAADDEHGSVT